MSNHNSEQTVLEAFSCLNNDSFSHMETVNSKGEASQQTIHSDQQSILPPLSSIEQACKQEIINNEQCSPKKFNSEKPCEQVSESDQKNCDQLSNSNEKLHCLVNEFNSVSTEPPYSDMSASLSKLLSAIEEETTKNQSDVMDEPDKNYLELEAPNEFNLRLSNENLEDFSAAKTTTTSSLNENIINRSEKRFNKNSDEEIFSQPRKKIKLGNLDVENSNSVLFELSEIMSHSNSSSETLQEIKQEKDDPLQEQSVELGMTMAAIKSEDSDHSAENNMSAIGMTESTAEGTVKDGIEPLPSYLEKFSKIKPSVVATRLRTLPNGGKIRIKVIKFPRVLNAWIFRETFLCFFDRNFNLRQKLGLGGKAVIYTNSTISDVHPVHVGPEFPFSCPKNSTKQPSKSPTNLPPPLAYLASKKPDIVSTRQTKINRKQITTITFAEEMLECAFKESLLSQFQDAPDATDMLNVEHTWPDCSFEALDAIEVDYKYPFSFADASREKGFFDQLDASLPSSFFQTGVQLPPVPAHLRKKFYMTRDYLLRLLGTSTFYVYSSTLAKLMGKEEEAAIYNSIISSLRPLVTSQANELGEIIVDIRRNLLSQFVSEDNNIIDTLINGPIMLNKFFFGFVRNIDKLITNSTLLIKRKES